jgi:hypothetical protein
MPQIPDSVPAEDMQLDYPNSDGIEMPTMPLQIELGDSDERPALPLIPDNLTPQSAREFLERYIKIRNDTITKIPDEDINKFCKPIDADNAVYSPTRFACRFCPKSYDRQDRFKDHVHTHLRIRPIEHNGQT